MNKLKEPVMLHTWIEKFDRQWLRAEAKKKRLSIAGLIRSYIKWNREPRVEFYKNEKKDD